MQVFLVWQLLQLETGDASSAVQCCTQIESFLMQLRTKAEETSENACSVATAQEPCEYADIIALVRFYTVDLLCNSLERYAAAAAALSASGPAGALLKVRGNLLFVLPCILFVLTLIGSVVTVF